MNEWLRVLARLLGGGAVRRRRPNPLLGAYRWRYEILLVGVLGGLVWLGYATHWVIPLAVVLVVGAVLAVSPGARDRCVSVLVQHRLRSAFHELCLTTWAGRTPAILWTAPRRGTLRVRLLLPAGIAARHFTPEVRETLAAACDVPEVRVEPHPRHTALVVLVVVIRAPVGDQPVVGDT